MSASLHPPLSLARLRVRNQLAEIRLEQLQFDGKEAGELLNGRLQLNLTPTQLTAPKKRAKKGSALYTQPQDLRSP